VTSRLQRTALTELRTEIHASGPHIAFAVQSCVRKLTASARSVPGKIDTCQTTFGRPAVKNVSRVAAEPRGSVSRERWEIWWRGDFLQKHVRIAFGCTVR
jgi:hypothetical protein